MGPGSRAPSALGRGLVSFSVCLFTSVTPIPNAVGDAENSVAISSLATGYELQAICRFFRFPGRGRLVRPRSGVHAGREADVLLSLTRKR